MADFNIAFQWMIHNEDSTLACAVVPDPCPKNVAGPCYAISGINSGAWSADFAKIAALPQANRLQAVQAFYQANYWNTWLAQIDSDELAKRVFDFAVNAGSGTSVKTLQTAINSLGGTLTVDGGWGPKTVAAANAADPVQLVAAFTAARVAYYQALAAPGTEDASYVHAWLGRAEA